MFLSLSDILLTFVIDLSKKKINERSKGTIKIQG